MIQSKRHKNGSIYVWLPLRVKIEDTVYKQHCECNHIGFAIPKKDLIKVDNFCQLLYMELGAYQYNVGRHFAYDGYCAKCNRVFLVEAYK